MQTVHESAERRLARNEDLFRRSNEAVARGLWPGDERGPMRLRCECARLGCQSFLEVPQDEYEQVRQHPGRFVLCEGHEEPEVERVVEQRVGYVVVQKIGPGEDEAEELDPRS
jgi:hypothetical protein